MRTSNQRTIYGEQLLHWGEQLPNLAVCEADLGKSTMTYAFQQKYPARYFEMGIAEACMTGFAAGLALTDHIVFTNSFAVFSAGRAYDQIRQGIAIGKLNVKIIGSSAGLSDFGDGATHQSVEDVAIMRAIPNMTVLVPADGPQVAEMMDYMVHTPGPMYLRISRNDLVEVTTPGCGLAPAVIAPGTGIALVAMGIMVEKALQARAILEGMGISARVVNVPCLKPLDEAAICQVLANVPAAVSCEEHSIIGGLSQCLGWALRGQAKALEAVAIQDRFGQSAPSAEDLHRAYSLMPEDIVQKALKALQP